MRVDERDRRASAQRLRVVGIDPGSSKTGYAFVDFEGARVVDLEVGQWSISRKQGAAESLAALADAAGCWLDGVRPDAAAVESLFTHRNMRSALVLAEARGVLLSTIGRLRIPLFEYPPATIKKIICGAGNADKERVRQALLLTVPGLQRFPLKDYGSDASDALAVAVCHQAHRHLNRF